MENKIKGQITCVVCGRDFPLIEEEHYVSREPARTGLAANIVVGSEPKLWDSFDCPHCCCQNRVQLRMYPWLGCGELCDFEDEEEDEDE